MTVTSGADYRKGSGDGMSIDGMTQTPAHAKPARRDHLWVLAVIAACCLIKVWPSWVGIGAEAGFPKLGKMATDWTLAVVIEAYWAYAVFAWLAATGWRSRRFAFWSAAVVFALSVTGQSAAPVMAAAAVKVFANALPVIVLALVAILVHLRHLDRAETAEADERTVVQAEMDALHAQVEALTAKLCDAESERDAARRDTASLTRKLAARKPNRTRTKTPNSGRRTGANAGGQKTPNSGADTQVPNDINVRAEALGYYLENPDISGRELGEKVGRGERWGQLRKNEFAAAAPKGHGPETP